MAKLTAIEIGDALNKQYGHEVLILCQQIFMVQMIIFLNSIVTSLGLISDYKAKSNDEDVFKVWGTGKPLREFLYVDDLSNAIEFLIENKIHNGHTILEAV